MSSTNHPENIKIGDNVWVKQGKTDHVATFLGPENDNDKALVKWASTGLNDNVSFASIRPMGRAMTRSRRHKRSNKVNSAALGTQNKESKSTTDSTSNLEATTSRNEYIFPNGTKVVKHWDGHPYNGTVIQYDPEEKWYRIHFEDNDVEDWTQEELLQHIDKDALTQAELRGKTNPKKTTRKACKREAAAVVLLSEDESGSDDDESDAWSMAQEESLEDDNTDDEEMLAIATTPHKQTTKKAKQSSSILATTVTPSPSTQKTRGKQHSPRKKSSPPSRRKLHRSQPSSLPSSATRRTIANFGLPRGALAKCPHTGVTIRSVDGILPLVKKDSWQHATSSATTTTTTTSSSNDTSLPGKILVVSADDNGTLLVPPEDFVGRTFASVKDICDRAKDYSACSSAINYDMEVVADPVFAPWEFLQDRLISSGLLPQQDDDDNDSNKNKGDNPMLFVVTIEWDQNSKNQVMGDVTWYREYIQKKSQFNVDDDSALLWTILETSQREITPSVLLGVPQSLLEHSMFATAKKTNKMLDINDDDENDDMNDDAGTGNKDESSHKNLLPLPISDAAKIRLSASLLQKSIRRGTSLCSSAPVAEACRALLYGDGNDEHTSQQIKTRKSTPPGSTLAMLKTLWECMMVDASPFDNGHDCLGLPSLLLLSLVAKADSTWTLPEPLRKMAVASALRTSQSTPSVPWVGFADRNNKWWMLEDCNNKEDSPTHQKARNLRNILRAAQSIVGGRLLWGKWSSFIGDASAAAVMSYLNHEDWDGSQLPAPPPSRPEDHQILVALENGKEPIKSTDPRINHLDRECQLAAIEPGVIPSALVLLQASLSCPPTKWRKHSLPALAKQVRKLISEANARHQEQAQLVRLATWGNDKAESRAPILSATKNKVSKSKPQQLPPASYQSFREVVTPTSILSQQENELVDCFEAIQEWVVNRLAKRSDSKIAKAITPDTPVKSAKFGEEVTTNFRQMKSGPPLTNVDGRIGFLLAFAFSIEVVVKTPFSEEKEVVSAMFCGDANEPLLVQRIGKARREGKEAATVGGTTSGATAVPSLGYVQRDRSKEERFLFEAAEKAVASHWKDGKVFPLPLPPAGCQWELSQGTEDLVWEAKEAAVERTATLQHKNGKKQWHFTIDGKEINAFDARPVMSPCMLDVEEPAVLQYGTDHDRLLRTALYVKSENENLSHGKAVLETLEKLHLLAEGVRETTFGGLSEGRVFNWIPLAQKSPIPARTWRDAILAIRTRDKNHVVLGKGIRSDGGGTPLDLSEGVLVRVFHVLEFLYPQAIRKESALKFRVRPRGAAYYHLLVSLEMLGRGEVTNEALGKCHSKRASTKVKQKRKHRGELKPNKNDDNRTVLDATDQGKRGDSQSIKRPRRCAAFYASKRITRMSTNEEQTNTISQRRSCLSQEKKEVKRRQIVKSRNNVRKRARKKKGDSDNESWGDNDEDVLSDDDNLDFDVDDEGSNSDKSDEEEKQEFLPLPKIKTKLWPHQEKSVSNIVEGVMNGKRGHADASAVGAGKTLTALATIVRLARWVEGSQKSRHGVLVMLPTKALIKEWLIEIATHTEGFHLIEQREDGTLFSLTYGKSHPPIDGNSLVISTLDRVCNHPFVRQAAWDFVVIDECLSVQNAGAKRTPSAWRQIEVSLCGVLMLSATFFRSKYDQLFYMIRMLRSPLPRTIEWLPATIHEHIVCQIPETDRSWKMVGEMVPLDANDLREYRSKIDKFRRKQINEPNVADGRKLWVDLECFLRLKYEGRTTTKTYAQTSPMGVAFVKAAKGLLRKGRKPLIFADTSQEGDFLIRVLRKQGLDACTWSEVRSRKGPTTSKTVIVAVKTVEGQGINMQGHANAIICRPTPGDHLEQMKGRIDRPGQKEKDLVLIVVVAEHTIEEAKFANIRLAGNFFREYIAPVATKYKERIDLEATLAAGGTKKLKSGTVSGTWKKSLETEGQSGAFADIVESSSSIPGSLNANLDTDTIQENATPVDKTSTGAKDEPKYKPLNKVLRNKGDPRAIRQAKSQAKDGKASQAVRSWLFPTKGTRSRVRQKGLAKDSLKRFSDTVPPLILDPTTIYEAVAHLSKEDSKLAALIARIGPDVLIRDCGIPQLPTQARLFDKCVRAITFTMVSVDAGTSFLRRLAMKIGVCLMAKGPSTCKKLLKKFLKSIKEAGGYENLKGHEDLLQCLLNGQNRQFLFTHDMMRELVDDCEIIGGKRSGYPHICGVTFPCGKNDDHSIFREKARAQASGESRETVSAGYSRGKASFLVSLVEDFENGTISGEKIANASDREAAKMLIGLKGIGDWSAAQVLMSFLSRADVMLYGDLTVRNYLNELYDINHQNESETLLESAADFGDTGENRNLIDDLAKKNKWSPYRSVVCYLMYYLQQENLVLL